MQVAGDTRIHTTHAILVCNFESCVARRGRRAGTFKGRCIEQHHAKQVAGNTHTHTTHPIFVSAWQGVGVVGTSNAHLYLWLWLLLLSPCVNI